ncbi:MAG: hypothetical protein AMS24_00160 [Chlamydiae bacterium SM23_39]|nr:MAG: hypothetical protein AMS24_00160 [Chlamydiae bacterium SM23_39]
MDVKKDFPIFKYQKSLVYLDSAATSHKPICVINTLKDFYSKYYATVHRGAYKLSDEATKYYNESRKKIAQFINASDEEIIFTSGTTDSINLVARSLAKDYIRKDDEIIVSEMEHHSNLVPWQMVAKEKKAKLKIIPMNKKGELILDHYKKILSDKTKIVAVAHIANTTGTINDIKNIIDLAHKKNALVLIDGAQSIAHLKVDVRKIDADFYAFSGHKMYGPTGVGVLYGKKNVLEKMPPIKGGGDMIDSVELFFSTYQKPPVRFEAGTSMIAQVIGLKKAVEYIEKIGLEKILFYENELRIFLEKKLKEIEEITIIGNADNKSSLVSFYLKDIHPLDIALFLDTKNIAVRSGHMCAQPTMRKFNISSALRVSFGIYNTKKDIDIFVEELKKIIMKLK